MHKNTPKRTNNYLSVLDGVRFYNSVFLIIAHGAAFIGQTAVSDTKAMEKLTTSLFITTIINLSIAVQVFFFMSTFLTTVNFYSHLRRAQEVTLGDVLRKIVKRYIRFTSAQAVFIALYSSWFIHLSRGPFWEQTVGFNHRQCNEKWWINLLYISNFFFDDGVCLPQMWHLSMDFQLTVIGLLILWWTQKNGKRLLFVSGILLLSQIVWTLLYLGWNNFEFSFLYTPEFLYNLTFTLSKEWQATWITTITNLAALAWGLIFGYMYSHRQNNTFITKRSYCIWWSTIVTVSCLGTILFSAYYKTTDYYSNSRWFAATYGSIEKVLFVFGFGLFIFGMLHGLGGCVKKVLEWAPMHALGKLSFGTYLIQFVFLNLDTGLKRYPLYVMVYLGATDILKYTTLSYLGSILLTSFVLMPMENLANKFL
ncbi:hypothetical protein Zmor_018898 [Zophobas morio]|uniref:Acyltransferase 3 domain-containing protein n=2 Tax=Zophobas morio TaxID=2755281 RepID=A0AA38IEY2_9CUCU|nr:hypothetical protein Zmor_018898 [Zophobas morio]